MTIGHRILLLILAPAAVLIVFAAWIVSERVSALAEAAQLQQGELAISAVDGLVGEWQRERGRSAQFLGSGAPTLSPELVTQRQAADRALTDLKGLDGANTDARVGAALAKALAAAQRLPALRADVMIGSDGPRVMPDVPTIATGTRGTYHFDLVVDLRPGGVPV